MTTQLSTFDTLDYANKLKATGLTTTQAETLAQLQKDFFQLLVSFFATKQDLKDLENRIIIKIGGLMVILVSVLATLITVLHVY